MDKTEAFKIVFEELKKCNVFCGIYDAKNGNESFMHGISMVMESIAYGIDAETGDNFSDLFTSNLIASEERK
jgi:hypothetical protein